MAGSVAMAVLFHLGFNTARTVVLAGMPEPTAGRGSDMHIFGYGPQGKTYTWCSVMPTGPGTRVLTLMVDGVRWVADWEATYQGKPASYHREWLEESPTALRYRSTRSVDGGGPILISEWRFTRTK
jgi:hypothetical protein